MDSENLERLIRNLGCSYDALIANKLIDNLPLQDLYEDGESLEVEPVPGVELIFWQETSRFELIHITLTIGQIPSTAVFSGNLPEPFESMKTQKQVHQTLGDPIFSKGLRELQGTGLAGWDTYQVPANLHPAALVDFQYENSFKISRVLFSLMDKNV